MFPTLVSETKKKVRDDMTREECELSIVYLESIKDNYIEGNGYERHPLPEYYAIETAIKALEQEPILDKIRHEIESCREDEEPHLVDYRYYRNEGLDMALDIIDKYKVESEDEE